MSWYRTGTVAVTNGSKTVTGVGTLFTTAVNVGDAFALVDANLNPTGAWYEVDAVVSNTEITLKQTYAGTTGSNKQFCVFNMVGNMTTPSFAQRLATFFASFQSLIDKPTATPTALGIPVADANGDIDSEWLKDASTTVKGVVKVGSNISVADGVISVPEATETIKGVVELATPAEVLAGTDTTRAVTPDTLTDKILGTVSQTAGVPTGAVIERGSNANGEYIKFADGTMMCHGQHSTNIPIETSINVWYESWLGNLSVYYPSTFINPPAVSCAGWLVADVSTGEAYAPASAQTYFLCLLKARINIGSAHTKTFRYLAIGRWF